MYLFIKVFDIKSYSKINFNLIYQRSFWHFYIIYQAAELIYEEQRASRSKSNSVEIVDLSKDNDEPCDLGVKDQLEDNNEVTILEEEQKNLLNFIPTDLLNNLPAELADTLRTSIADERSKLVAHDTSEGIDDIEEEKTKNDDNNVQEASQATIAEGKQIYVILSIYLNLLINLYFYLYIYPFIFLSTYFSFYISLYLQSIYL